MNIDQEQVYKSLKTIVDNFNKDLHDWMEDTGCRVNFGFNYGLDRDVKSLEIMGVDLIVWRKQPPGAGVLKGLTMGEVLGGSRAKEENNPSGGRDSKPEEELRDTGGVRTEARYGC
jgi:hypothetical protein